MKRLLLDGARSRRIRRASPSRSRSARTARSGSANVAYTGTAGSTATFQAGPQMVLVYCSTACFVKIGEAVTATTADIPLPGNVVAVLRVPPGTGAPWRVSAIQASSGGSVFAQPVN
jgi:hypothetical protein